jgi:4-hydroxybutyrate CoA-transferase
VVVLRYDTECLMLCVAHQKNLFAFLFWQGFCSLGCGVEFTHDFIQHANIVIAEVTRHMPWTEGPSKIPVQDIDYWVRVDDKLLLTTAELWPEYERNRALNVYSQEVRDGIGKNIARYIADGATLKFGVNPIPFIDSSFLRERKHLGLHTDVMSEDLFQLQRDGIIDNSKKTIDKGRTATSLAHGSQELYEYLDRNPAIEFHPTSYINDPQVIAKIDNFVAILGALKIDLSGQVATESIAHKVCAFAL